MPISPSIFSSVSCQCDVALPAPSAGLHRAVARSSLELEHRRCCSIHLEGDKSIDGREEKQPRLCLRDSKFASEQIQCGVKVNREAAQPATKLMNHQVCCNACSVDCAAGSAASGPGFRLWKQCF